jgi:glycosyltransferase involved in cell wall biosynthesis
MRETPWVIDVLIPVLNEEGSLPFVLKAIPEGWIRKIVVCDNGSTDRTVAVALENGAEVVVQKTRGYGNACLAGIDYLRALPEQEQPDIVVFLDGDYADYPEELPLVVGPILKDEMDLVIGSRLLGNMEAGAMTLPQRFGNWLAPFLIRLFFGYKFTDLGPFRAIRWEKLLLMGMVDRNFGWTVEMQVKAAKMRLACTEVPVRYRKRVLGESKVSGTVRGAFNAGVIILSTIFKALIRRK